MLAVATLLLASPLPVVVGWCSPDYRVRDRASVLAVARYGPDAWRWADTLTCPECQVRAERARTAAVSAALKRLGPYPCADAAWYDTAGRGYYRERAVNSWVAAGLEAALNATGRDAYPHESFRQATRTWTADRLRAGASEAGLKKLLDEMRRRDAAYYRNTNQTIPW